MTIHAVNDLNSSLKKVRALHLILLLEIPLFVYAGEVFSPAKTKDARGVELFLLALAAFNIWSVLSWYRRRVRMACEALRSHPGDPKAVTRWKAVSIALLSLCLPFALYGFVLRVSGGTFLEAAPFYACALFLLLVFTPRRP